MAGLITLDHVRQALVLTEFDSASARQRMAPVPRGWQKRNTAPKLAAVMVLVYAGPDSRLSTAITLRNPDLRGHSGQVSFPGGQQEPQDEDLTTTAVRETCEEIGISSTAIAVLGRFSRFYIPASHFDVYPIVALYDGVPVFRANPAEVTEVFSFALEDLLQDKFKCEEQRVIRGFDVRVPYYHVSGHKVWGATAIMLSELEHRLRHVLPKATLLMLG